MANAKPKQQTAKKTQSKKAPAKKPETRAKNPQTQKVQNKNNSERKGLSAQMTAVILFCVALLLLAFCFIPGASAWEFVRQHVMFGTFGITAYLVPVLLGYIAILTARDKLYDKGKIGKIIGICLFMLFFSSFVHIVAHDFEYFSKNTVWEQIKDVYAVGLKISNGGFFGALLGGFIAYLCGAKMPAVVFVSILSFGTLMVLTGTTLAQLFGTIEKPVRKAGDKIAEHKEKRKQSAEEDYDDADADEFFDPQGVDFTPDFDLDEEPERKAPEKPLKAIEVDDSDFYQFDPNEIIMPPPIMKKSGATGTSKNRDNKFRALDIDLVDEDNPTVPQYEPEAEEIVPEEPPVVRQPERKTPEKPKKPAEVFEVSETAYVSTRSGKSKPYKFPPLSCLSKPDGSQNIDYSKELQANGQHLIDVLKSFGVEAKICEICRGPSVTRYELQPAPGVKISKITNLSNDIAMNMAASGVRIEAPIPNKSAIGIEIPNRKRTMVLFREIIDTPEYRDSDSKLNVALGKDITGNIICADLSKMPHLLIAGTTGSGKSVCINSMIVSILYNATPDEVKLLMIDPKQVEFTVYNGIPHLLVPVVSDPRKAAGALSWAVTEMLNRYKLFAERNVRNIKGYNKFCEANPEIPKLPHIVIFIDELSDLMMAAPNEVEESICRLAQMARAAGMHLVIATQRPSVNVITGVIKANIPSRISLSVSSQIDSRTIIDAAGAEKLLGNGDMLFSPVGMSKPLRVQGAFLSDTEVEDVVEFIKGQQQGSYDEDIIEEIENHAINEKKRAGYDVDDDGDDEADEMLPDAIRIVVEMQQASTTMLQKKLKLGYARASRIIDDLEERGIIGPSEGAKPRKVLLSKQQYMEMSALSSDGKINLNRQSDDMAFDDVTDEDDDF
ncbi:MAG: DNA translocase FtsK [Ruminococcaceae bacterium]|nr:DNA translocase FtsK [Oscillospiraceae bacterium]